MIRLESDPKTFRLPRDDESTAIVGRNGSGKTQLGAWLLSQQDFRRKPWVILDYKRDELLNSIERVREIGHDEIPKKPGLYLLHSRHDMADDMEKWLWSVHEAENTGLYVDEGYMLPQDNAFRALLTQGRSKNIPIITLSQRPVKIDRFVFSEASHLILFHLNDDRDEKTVNEIAPRGFVEWIPEEFNPATRLPKYHSRWYNIKDDVQHVLAPVPDADEIRADIDAKLEPKRRWL